MFSPCIDPTKNIFSFSSSYGSTGHLSISEGSKSVAHLVTIVLVGCS